MLSMYVPAGMSNTRHSRAFNFDSTSRQSPMQTYRIRLVGESGPDPLSGEQLDRVEETVAVEASSLWEAYRRATLKMTLNLNGRLLRGYDADTGELAAAPASDMEWRKGHFEIESIQGPYSGITEGESWNGWAVPYFELEEAKRIASDYEQVAAEAGGDLQGSRAEYDAAEDRFVFYDPINDYEFYYNAITAVVEGKEVKAYAVGTREWTWEEARVPA